MTIFESSTLCGSVRAFSAFSVHDAIYAGSTLSVFELIEEGDVSIFGCTMIGSRLSVEGPICSMWSLSIADAFLISTGAALSVSEPMIITGPLLLATARIPS